LVHICNISIYYELFENNWHHKKADGVRKRGWEEEEKRKEGEGERGKEEKRRKEGRTNRGRIYL
jgi:hypothetical protein